MALILPDDFGRDPQLTELQKSQDAFKERVTGAVASLREWFVLCQLGVVNIEAIDATYRPFVRNAFNQTQSVLLKWGVLKLSDEQIEQGKTNIADKPIKGSKDQIMDILNSRIQEALRSGQDNTHKALTSLRDQLLPLL